MAVKVVSLTPRSRCMLGSLMALLISALSASNFLPITAASLSIVRTDGMVSLSGSCIPFFIWRKVLKVLVCGSSAYLPGRMCSA